MDDYYGPCDVRSQHGVMRLHCELNPGRIRGHLANHYRAPALHDIARQTVTVCLPGGANLTARTGDTSLRVDEPIGWSFEREDEQP